MVYRFLQPLDVLFLRGNKLFGNPGSFGEALLPPWPAVAAGALRSAILASAGIDLGAFAAGQVPHPSIGTPAAPGPFRVTAFHLARRVASGACEALIAPPADLILTRDAAGALQVDRLVPTAPAPGLASSAALPLLPVLAAPSRRKPVGDLWLDQRAWASYLAGDLPIAANLVPTAALWRLDARIGVGLDPERRRADDGKLFTAQAVALCPEVGFLVGIAGAEVPTSGVVRFGGDGRAAAIQAAPGERPTPDLAAIARAGRCRLILTSPGIFPGGWCLPGVGSDQRLRHNGVRARLVSAAVPRADTVSGWDLAQWQPKAAQRAAPTGSVYWLDELEATPEALRELTDAGLWDDPGAHPARRAEGFNRFTFAAWA
ncbi:MAG: type III-B CRISPR module-associated protein Cmr3 [Chromatiaceae bacterium]|nr:MAG: type III-B CRISPR module-associated protein Cmr3 [Chromatiaceae bacterium]